MLHDRLIETIASHASIVEEAANRGIDWSETLQLYAVLHALQVHAQAVIDYLLHTCSLLGISAETPTRCITELRHRGLMSGDEEDALKHLVRFRNIVVHGYATIDINKVRGIVERKEYWKVTMIIKKLHEELEKRGILDP